jgi:hypothetical protein
MSIDIANTGSYIWNVPSAVCGTHSFSIEVEFEHPLSYSTIFNIAGSACDTPTPSALPTTVACTSIVSNNSPQPTGENQFINQAQWIYPVVGTQMKVQWSPSTASTISLQLTYYAYVPDDTNSFWLTSKYLSILSWEISDHE